LGGVTAVIYLTPLPETNKIKGPENQALWERKFGLNKLTSAEKSGQKKLLERL
jgi:hypothetical protein